MKLYTYYRSQASFRVRIALNLKGIAREDSFLHLEKGDQFAAAYRAINPQMVVPTLIDGTSSCFSRLLFWNISTRHIRSRRYCRPTHWQGPGYVGLH
jgi:glutathione S-transferase